MSGADEVVLRASGLTMRFGGLTALDAVDLTVRRGEVLGLLGPNGSGKTTFFNVVTGLYRASGGSVSFGGTDLSGASPQAVCRAGITRTFQRSRLGLPLSVFDNLMVGKHTRLNHGLIFNLLRRGRLREQYRACVDEARELLRGFNPSLADRLFDAAGTVSMIDRRRIEICRALISAPKLLLLDEPSAGMTHEETRELMDDILAVRARIAGLSIVVIEHEMNMIERLTDRCIVLNHGRKLCEGSFRDIAANAEVQQAYLGTAL